MDIKIEFEVTGINEMADTKKFSNDLTKLTLDFAVDNNGDASGSITRITPKTKLQKIKELISNLWIDLKCVLMEE